MKISLSDQRTWFKALSTKTPVPFSEVPFGAFWFHPGLENLYFKINEGSIELPALWNGFTSANAPCIIVPCTWSLIPTEEIP